MRKFKFVAFTSLLILVFIFNVVGVVMAEDPLFNSDKKTETDWEVAYFLY